VGAVCDELEETLGGPPDSSGKWNCDMPESITGEVATSVRPCLLLGYLRGWEGIISYPEIPPIGCLLVRVLRG
jgi:hypothetical protein